MGRLIALGGTRAINLEAFTYVGALNTLAPILNHPDYLFVRESMLRSCQEVIWDCLA